MKKNYEKGRKVRTLVTIERRELETGTEISWNRAAATSLPGFSKCKLMELLSIKSGFNQLSPVISDLPCHGFQLNYSKRWDSRNDGASWFFLIRSKFTVGWEIYYMFVKRQKLIICELIVCFLNFSVDWILNMNFTRTSRKTMQLGIQHSSIYVIDP